MRSAFATYIRTQLAAFSIRCVVTTKKHTTLVNIWNRLHLYTQFAIFSFPTILPTANFALFSLWCCGHPLGEKMPLGLRCEKMHT